ncbi:MAG: MBL fold metallo-hydrolase [Clostridia bacterium]|nr:MBL fold metallo-hydrolase [Clostridia bacterium]
MANKKPSKSNKQSLDTKKIIAILAVILVILLIIAIILISIRGMWKDIIDFVKGYFDEEDLPSGEQPSGSLSSGSISNKPIPSGVAQLNGAIMEMRVLDIGQGDCILFILPDGQVMIMDIGNENGTASHWDDVIVETLTELQITTIDYLFLSHTDYDHIREADKLVARCDIKNFYLPVADIGTSGKWGDVYNAALAETYEEDGVVKQATINYNVGAYEIHGENWVMKCYSFDEADYPLIKKSSSALNKNSVSPICLLEYAGRTIVLTGDSNEKNEPYLINKGYFDNVDADILKVAHHGSKTSTCMDFLNKIDCEYAIISCGAGNDYGHPTSEALNRLDTYTDLVPDDDYNGYAQVYRTDEDGTVIVQIDEDGVINLITEKNESKNTTTGTPIGETESGEVVSGQVALVRIVRYEVDYEELLVA